MYSRLKGTLFESLKHFAGFHHPNVPFQFNKRIKSRRDWGEVVEGRKLIYHFSILDSRVEIVCIQAVPQKD